MIDQMAAMNALLDAYESLLTEKQQIVMDYYYKEDFSFAEIAEAVHISRAGVHDHIKRSTQILLEYEKKLKLVHNNNIRLVIYDKIKKIGNDEVKKLILQLEHVDY